MFEYSKFKGIPTVIILAEYFKTHGSREKCHHLHHGLLAEMISESKQISHFTSCDKILQDLHERFMKKVFDLEI